MIFTRSFSDGILSPGFHSPELTFWRTVLLIRSKSATPFRTGSSCLIDNCVPKSILVYTALAEQETPSTLLVDLLTLR